MVSEASPTAFPTRRTSEMKENKYFSSPSSYHFSNNSLLCAAYLLEPPSSR